MSDLKRCDMVFVYGTLKSGFGNHRQLSSSEYLGEARTADSYYMIGTSVPVVIPGGEHSVAGELYHVTEPSVLMALDDLEGHPTLYRREIIPVIEEDGEQCHAWCYIWSRPSSYPYPHLDKHETFGEVQIF